MLSREINELSFVFLSNIETNNMIIQQRKIAQNIYNAKQDEKLDDELKRRPSGHAFFSGI